MITLSEKAKPSVPDDEIITRSSDDHIRSGCPPEYMYEHIPTDWEIIKIKDIKKMEQEQLSSMISIIDQILQLEYNNEELKDTVLCEIVSDINVKMKYKEICITVEKIHPTTIYSIIKSIPKKIMGVAFDHPLKFLGLLTVISLR